MELTRNLMVIKEVLSSVNKTTYLNGHLLQNLIYNNLYVDSDKDCRSQSQVQQLCVTEKVSQ